MKKTTPATGAPTTETRIAPSAGSSGNNSLPPEQLTDRQLDQIVGGGQGVVPGTFARDWNKPFNSA